MRIRIHRPVNKSSTPINTTLVAKQQKKQPVNRPKLDAPDPKFNFDLSKIPISSPNKPSSPSKINPKSNNKTLRKEPHQSESNFQVSPLQKSIQRRGGILPGLMSTTLAGDPILEAIYKGKGRLRRGDKGEAVRRIQLVLLDLGYQLPKYGADSDFGGETKAAVIAFQKNKGISPNGAINRMTVNWLDRDHSEGQQISSPESDDLASDPDIRNIDVDCAMEQNIVHNRLLGFAERDDWPEPIGSTNYAYRVAKFQKEKGLEIDGIMGTNTWTIRGEELGIDVPSEISRWAKARKNFSTWPNVPIENFVDECIYIVRNYLSSKAHKVRIEQLIKQVKPQLETIAKDQLPKYKKQHINTVAVSFYFHLESGASFIEPRIDSLPIASYKDKEDAMENFAQTQGIPRSRVIWIPGHGPAEGFPPIPESINWQEIPENATDQEIWDMVRKGQIKNMPVTEKMRNSEAYQKIYDLVTLGEITKLSVENRLDDPVAAVKQITTPQKKIKHSDLQIEADRWFRYFLIQEQRQKKPSIRNIRLFD